MGTQILIPLSGSKIGFNGSVATTGWITVQNAVVVEPGGVQARVLSTSANDSTIGTGIQKVRIRYFDTNWTLNDEIVTMNGTTAVNTVATNIIRIESFEAFQIGTPLGGSAGIIKLQNLAGNQLFAQIDVGGNQFLRAQHTVSPGKIGTITDVIINNNTTIAVSFVVYREVDNTPNGGNVAMISDTSVTVQQGGTMQIALSDPIRCDATSSVQGLRMGISAIGLAVGGAALVSFHFRES